MLLLQALSDKNKKTDDEEVIFQQNLMKIQIVLCTMHRNKREQLIIKKIYCLAFSRKFFHSFFFLQIHNKMIF